MMNGTAGITRQLEIGFYCPEEVRKKGRSIDQLNFCEYTECSCFWQSKVSVVPTLLVIRFVLHRNGSSSTRKEEQELWQRFDCIYRPSRHPNDDLLAFWIISWQSYMTLARFSLQRDVTSRTIPATPPMYHIQSMFLPPNGLLLDRRLRSRGDCAGE